MNALYSFTSLLCAVCIGIAMLSMLAPQKRTRRTLSFVLGLFLLVSVISSAAKGLSELRSEISFEPDVSLPSVSDAAPDSEVLQYTADALVTAADELLREEGIAADDIRITLKISPEGRIYADRVVIYISESYRDRKSDIEAIIYRNLSKEPDIYVKGQEAQRADNG